MAEEFHSVVAGRSKITRQFKSEYSTDKTKTLKVSRHLKIVKVFIGESGDCYAPGLINTQMSLSELFIDHQE